MLRDQHGRQVEQKPRRTALWMAHDGVDAGVNQRRGFHVALPLCHAALPAQREDRQHGKDHTYPPADPSSPLWGLEPRLLENEYQGNLSNRQYRRDRL